MGDSGGILVKLLTLRSKGSRVRTLVSNTLSDWVPPALKSQYN